MMGSFIQNCFLDWVLLGCPSLSIAFPIEVHRPPQQDPSIQFLLQIFQQFSNFTTNPDLVVTLTSFFPNQNSAWVNAPWFKALILGIIIALLDMLDNQ